MFPRNGEEHLQVFDAENFARSQLEQPSCWYRGKHSLGTKADDACTLPTWCVWGKLSLFNALETGFYRKLVALRNLEAKILKTANLCGPCTA